MFWVWSMESENYHFYSREILQYIARTCLHNGSVFITYRHGRGFSFPCTWKLTYKIWLEMAQWFLRKASFNFHMQLPWATVKKRSRNDIDLQYLTYHHKLNQMSASCNFQVTGCNSFRKYSLFSGTFSYRKPKLTNLTLPWNRSRST